MNARYTDRAATVCLWLAGAVIILLLAVFLGYILYKGLPALSLDFILGRPKELEAGGGVGPQLFNSFYILILSMAVSIPLAVGAGIYLAEYAPPSRLT